MAYRSDKESWVRRSEEAERAQAAEARAQTAEARVQATEAALSERTPVWREGPLARPRVRVGAACQVLARLATDELGQIERIVDLTVSLRDDPRGDGNASIIFDVGERYLILMDDNGHEAFLLQLSLESSRSRARFL